MPDVMPDAARLLQRQSFSELCARQRARALLDGGSFRELIDPFTRLESPWLAAQGIVPQADDGVVIARGTLEGHSAVVCAIEGGFQGGSLGEVGGAKIAASLERAAADNRNGIPTRAVLCLETGGVRLQEANLGLAAIAEIHAAIVDLQRYQPVVGVIAGPIGCFGGMAIAAGLCSDILMTREARLGLNGPQVIEQEAGIDEYDSRDRSLIWGLTGGAQRAASALADACLDDDVAVLAHAVRACFRRGLPSRLRCRRQDILPRLQALDTRQHIDAEGVRRFYQELST